VQSADHRANVDTPVLIEAPVFDAEHGLNQVVGKVFSVNGISKWTRAAERLTICSLDQESLCIDFLAVAQRQVAQNREHPGGKQECTNDSPACAQREQPHGNPAYSSGFASQSSQILHHRLRELACRIPQCESGTSRP
jgi:hypothetical protein